MQCHRVLSWGLFCACVWTCVLPLMSFPPFGFGRPAAHGVVLLLVVWRDTAVSSGRIAETTDQQAVQQYLVSELSNRDKTRQERFSPRSRPPSNAPRQHNSSDCGVLMLHVMEVCVCVMRRGGFNEAVATAAAVRNCCSHGFQYKIL